MNAVPILHLAWKEYRAVRAFWLSLVVLVLAAQAITLLWSTNPATGVIVVCNIALAAPAFFALGCAGAAFAVEREEGTFDFLQSAPVSPRQVFTSKLGLTALATVAMLALLWPAALVMTAGQVPEAPTLRGMLGLWLLAAVEAIAWGTLFSLLTARPLVAVCLALATVSTLLHFLASSAATGPGYAFNVENYLQAWPWRTSIVTMVLAGDVYLGLRWLHGPDAIKLRVRPKAQRRKLPAPLESGPAESDALQQLVAQPDRGAILGRLCWQHFRQSAWLMLLMAGLQIVLTVLAAQSGLPISALPMASLFGLPILRLVGLPFVPLVGMAAVMGSCVFLPDQERRQFRFFVEHNVPPRYVWLTRQLPWLATVFVSSLVAGLLWVLVATSAPNSFAVGNPDLSTLIGWMLLGSGVVASIAVSYAAGQWTSMMVRSGLLAGFFGLLLTGLLCGWVTLMLFLQVAWWWSVWPIPLVLLWATWLRAPDWMREKATWTARGKAAAAVAAPALALVLVLPAYEINRVPLVSPGFDPAQYEARIPADGRTTAELYRRAGELYVSTAGDFIPRDFVSVTKDRKPSAKRLRWLDQNAEPLKLLLEASPRPNCLLADPRTVDDMARLRHGPQLISLMIISARQLEAEGKLDEALDRYFAALRAISHWSQDYASRWILRFANSDDQPLPADEMGRVLEELPYWAAQPGQTVQRIRAAVDRVRSLHSSMLHLDDGLQSAYLVARRYAMGDYAAAGALLGYWANNSDADARVVWGKLMPWEKYRQARALDQTTRGVLGNLQWIRSLLRNGDGVITSLPADPNHFFNYDEWSSLYLASVAIQRFGQLATEELAEFEEWQRATVLLLALEAYRLEHGELPESLDALVGTYFETLPRDPYSGLDFDYFPKGIPAPETELEKTELGRRWYGKAPIVPEVPCIWSTSASLAVQYSQPLQTSEEMPEPAEIPYYVRRGENQGARNRLPDFVAWRLGNWFPIPARRE